MPAKKKSLNGLGLIAQQQGKFDEAKQYHEQSRAINREIGDRAGEAKSLNNLGLVARQQGKLAEAKQYYDESLAINREIGDRAGEAKSLGNLGAVAQHQGKLAEAKDYHEESLAINREIGDRAEEAKSLSGLGLVAHQQGKLVEAKQYHEESLAIEREIGDRSGEAKSLNNLGAVAQEQNDHETAQARFAEASDTFEEIGAVRRALKSLTGFSRSAAEMGDTETVLDACERALTLIAESDLNGLDDRVHEFQIRSARHDESPEGTLRLYYHALRHVLENEGGTAADLLGETWERRETHEAGETAFSATLAAGVGYAAHLRIFDTEDESTDADDVLAELEHHEDDLATPELELYRALRDEDPGATPDDLRGQVEGIEPESDLDEIGIVEHRAYARLLELLSTDTDASADDLTTDDLYEQALIRMVSEEPDPSEILQLLTAAWESRDDHEPDSTAYATATAAGIGLAAQGPLTDGDVIDTEELLDEIDPSTVSLVPAVEAVYQQLTGEEPAYTPEQLRETIDTPLDDPRTDELETLVFAGLLDTLQSS